MYVLDIYVGGERKKCSSLITVGIWMLMLVEGIDADIWYSVIVCWWWFWIFYFFCFFPFWSLLICLVNVWDFSFLYESAKNVLNFVLSNFCGKRVQLFWLLWWKMTLNCESWRFTKSLLERWLAFWVYKIFASELLCSWINKIWVLIDFSFLSYNQNPKFIRFNFVIDAEFLRIEFWSARQIMPGIFKFNHERFRWNGAQIQSMCYVFDFFHYFLIFQSSGTILVHEDDRRKRSDHEIISEDEKRRRRMRSLRRKAMNGSTKITHTLRKRSRGVLHCHFASISTEEFLDEEEKKAVNAFRQVLIERDLLPAQHDDYHTLLRYCLYLFFFQLSFENFTPMQISIFCWFTISQLWLNNVLLSSSLKKGHGKGVIFSVNIEDLMLIFCYNIFALKLWSGVPN